MGTGNPHKSGVHAQPRRTPPLQPNTRTNDYLRCLAAGAIMADPGDLDRATADELDRRTAAGELELKWHHGRREWRQK